MTNTSSSCYLVNVYWLLQGMVDAGEQVSVTLKREFSEEAMNTLEASPEEKKRLETSINKLFTMGDEVGQPYTYQMLGIYIIDKQEMGLGEVECYRWKQRCENSSHQRVCLIIIILVICPDLIRK